MPRYASPFRTEGVERPGFPGNADVKYPVPILPIKPLNLVTTLLPNVFRTQQILHQLTVQESPYVSVPVYGSKKKNIIIKSQDTEVTCHVQILILKSVTTKVVSELKEHRLPPWISQESSKRARITALRLWKGLFSGEGSSMGSRTQALKSDRLGSNPSSAPC